MLPSSAAMVKNLQTCSKDSPFLMENLLQSKPDLKFTLNLAASLVARRQCEAGLRNRDIPSPSGDFDQRSCLIRAVDNDRLRRQERIQALQDSYKESLDHQGSIYVEVDERHAHVDRLCVMERLCNERIEENLSRSAMDSSNSNVDEDRGSVETTETGLQSDREHEDLLRARGYEITVSRNIIHEETTIRTNNRETIRIGNVDRIGETSCSCGDEQCTRLPCDRTIQEKEKPQLKFSVNAILGANHDKRPNSGNLSVSFISLTETTC